MKPLKSRHERFCRRFVECSNATLAAKIAGYAPLSARSAGYRLMRHPRILDRIVTLQREMAERNCGDVNVLLGKLEILYRRAVDGRQFSAAARAVELQAKLSIPGATRTARSSRQSPTPVANDDEPSG